MTIFIIKMRLFITGIHLFCNKDTVFYKNVFYNENAFFYNKDANVYNDYLYNRVRCFKIRMRMFTIKIHF